MTAITLAITDWHATKACAAYLSGDESLAIIDHLERMANLQGWQKPAAEAAE